MFDFYLYRPHGRGWYRLLNCSAPDYRTAARQAAVSSGARKIKVVPADSAALASMNRRSVVINFRTKE